MPTRPLGTTATPTHRNKRVDHFVRGLFDIAQRNRSMLLAAVTQRLTDTRARSPTSSTGSRSRSEA